RFVVTGLIPGQQYYFAVQAIDNSNFNSGVSNVPQAMAYNPENDTTPPEQITTLSASNSAGGEVTISWVAPGGDGSSGTTLYYEIRSATFTIDASNFAQASLMDSIPVPNSAGFAEGAKIYDLEIGQTYYIAVKSVDGAGNVSILSNIAVVAIGPDLIGPGIITDLTAVAGTNIGEVVIGWTASGNDGTVGKAKEYDIRYSTSQMTDGSWQTAVKALNTPSPEVSGTYQSATIGSLIANQRYYFGIKASDTGSNISGLSNIATAKAKGGTPPGKISDLSGKMGSTDGSVILSWTAPASADTAKVKEYEIRYSTDHIYEVNLWRVFTESEVEWNGAGKYPTYPSPVNPGEPQAFILNNLTPGQKYYFAVKSYDSDNNSSVISNVTETFAGNNDAIAPATVGDLYAEPGNVDGEVILNWTAPGNNGTYGTAASYIVKYSIGYIDNSTWDLANALADTPVPKSAGSKEHMFVRNLLAKHRYYFAMKAVDPVGNVSDISNCAETLSGPVMNLERVRSFPNPWKKASGGLITISHLTAKAKVKIFNLLGELVRELEEQNGVTFWDAKNENGQDVASGVYIYYAYDDAGHEKTGKIAIIK
ncbi:MAG: fibronectin type III domain-containing protein, partial [bacterium]|nr:fibronectin type III domain-containing protein [bacterium]